MNNRHVYLSGWIAFCIAVLTALHGLAIVTFTTREGAPTLTIGIVGGFLGYAASAFGISAYSGRNK